GLDRDVGLVAPRRRSCACLALAGDAAQGLAGLRHCRRFSLFRQRVPGHAAESIRGIRFVLEHLTGRAGGKSVPITPVTAPALKRWLKTQRAAVRKWVEGVRFTAKPGQHALIPAPNGALGRVLLGVEAAPDIW